MSLCETQPNIKIDQISHLHCVHVASYATFSMSVYICLYVTTLQAILYKKKKKKKKKKKILSTNIWLYFYKLYCMLFSLSGT